MGIIFIGGVIYIIVNHIGMPTRSTSSDNPAGFLLGLWQGAIIFLSFVASWFDNNIVLYEAKNDGFWYNLGYFLGVIIAIGGSASSSQKSKSEKNLKE